MALFLVFVCFVALSRGEDVSDPFPNSSASEIRFYGADAKTDLEFNCCEQEVEDLKSCLRFLSQPEPVERSERSKIAVVSMASTSIESFSLFSEFLNKEWAKSKGYDFIMATVPEDRPRARDIIWDKLIVMREHLHKYEVLYFIDADAIILQLDLNDILSTYNNSDIIISRDSANSAQGGAWMNTGSILVRNNAWTQQFFIDWWETGNRFPFYKQKDTNIFMEQGCLGQMLQERTDAKDKDFVRRVKVLSAGEINSLSPVWKTLGASTTVLHLENTPGLTRANIFKKLFEGNCHKNFELSRDFLYHEYLKGARVDADARPTNPWAQQSLGTLLSNGEQFGVAGDSSADAIAAARKAIKLNPSEPFHHTALSNAYKTAGRMDDYVTERKKALDLAPEISRLNADYGKALSEVGRYEDAVTYYRKAVDGDPENAENLNELGNLLAVRIRSYGESVDIFQRAVKADPKLWSAWNGLGLAAMLDREYEISAGAYKRVLELVPAEAVPHHGYGRLLLKTKHHSQAIKQLKLALSLTTAPSPHIFFDLAQAYGNRGDYEDALEYAEKALKLEPSNPNFQKGVKTFKEYLDD